MCLKSEAMSMLGGLLEGLSGPMFTRRGITEGEEPEMGSDSTIA